MGQVGPYSAATKPIYVHMPYNKVHTNILKYTKIHNSLYTYIIHYISHIFACYSVLYHTYRGVPTMGLDTGENLLKMINLLLYGIYLPPSPKTTNVITYLLLVHKVRKTGIHNAIIHARCRKRSTSFYKKMYTFFSSRYFHYPTQLFSENTKIIRNMEYGKCLKTPKHHIIIWST